VREPFEAGIRTRRLLRFLTCGSVDDGKSTLIGRLLYDAGLVPEDQWASIVRLSAQRGQTGDLPDYSLLLDGLLDERAQGITIDVAWRYFQTPRRKFILGDAPGHEQYTRNMATGASQCDLALILIDARKGILPQTRRHTAIVRLMGIRDIVVVVNKMDLVGWDELAFINLQRDFLAFARPLGVSEPVFVPVSAVHGDNVVNRSGRMSWYTGLPLLEYLEGVDVQREELLAPLRLPVQWVVRNGDFRGFSGTIASGTLRLDDPIASLPSGVRSRVASIVTFDGNLDEACAGQAVTVTLKDNVDVTRGDTIVSARDEAAVVTDRLEADVVWMEDQPLLPGRRYELRIGTASVPATVKRLIHRLNLESLQQEPATRLEKNDIGQCDIMTERPVPADLYRAFRGTGGFVLIDRISNVTVAAGMVTSNTARQVFWEEVSVNKGARASAKGQHPRVLWFTGLSGAGKSTLANAVERALYQQGFHTYLIDGDNVRHGLSKDLGFSPEDRIENTRRVGELAKLMADAGLVVLVSLISPFRAERKMVRDLMEPGEFLEVYVDTPLEVCEKRDRKGLYKMAREGRILNFTGISSPYEPPEAAEIVLDTSREPLEVCVRRLASLVGAGDVNASNPGGR
jgi:bifunctional enzyme CysN/CysC